MTPVASGWEARYLRASRAAHRAWAGSQPQFVIPGVLEAADAGTVRRLEPAGPPPTHTPQGGGLDLNSTRRAEA